MNRTIILKITSYCSIFALFFNFLPATIAVAGDYQIPVEITSCDQLQAINNNLTGDYKLMSDIDCSATSTWNEDPENLGTYRGFQPIGGENLFTGNLDGNNKTITGLYINRPDESNVGLFGTIGLETTSVQVKDLTITDSDITGSNNVGILAGSALSNDESIPFKVSNVHIVAPSVATGSFGLGGIIGSTNNLEMNSTSVAGTINVNSGYGGGLVGALSNDGPAGLDISSSFSTANVIAIEGATNVGGALGYINCSEGWVCQIDNLYSTGNVTGEYYVGGLIGNIRGGEISNSYTTGKVTGGANNVGGLVGSADNSNIIHSYASGDVTGGYDCRPGIESGCEGNTEEILVGGLIGDTTGNVTTSFATGDVIGYGNKVGGLIGSSSGSTYKSYATGDVTGNYLTGGFIGYNGGTIEVAFAFGQVTSTGAGTGGFVGTNDIGHSITNAYATGNVQGGDNSGSTGGFAGSNYGDITNAYSTGTVSGADQVGGFVGFNGTMDSLYSSFSTGSTSGTGYGIGGFIGDSYLSYHNSGWVINNDLDAVGRDAQKGFDSVTLFPGGSGVGEGYNENSKNAFYNAEHGIYTAGESIWDFETPIWVAHADALPTLAVFTPIFSDFSGGTGGINITPGQYITTNPFIIQVNPLLTTGSIKEVKFFVDNNLICTAATATEGIYSCSWDTSKYHSDVRVVVYSGIGTSSEITRNTTVDPKLYLTVLPKTGK